MVGYYHLLGIAALMSARLRQLTTAKVAIIQVGLRPARAKSWRNSNFVRSLPIDQDHHQEVDRVAWVSVIAEERLTRNTSNGRKRCGRC